MMYQSEDGGTSRETFTMRGLFTILSLLLCMLGIQARAAAPDPALQQDLLGLYDRYGKLIQAGKMAEAAQLRTAKPRAELLALGRKPKREQAEMLEMARLMTPDGVTPVHANSAVDGKTVTIEAVASKTWPAGLKFPDAPKPGTVTHGEVTLQFGKEGQTWKLQDQMFGPDPATIKVCHDEPAETEAAYNRTSNSNVGGQIRRVEFKPDHTLVVIRIVDEEDCLIMPPRDWLAQHDGHPDKLVPWALIEIDGAPHGSDKQRYWADKWTVTDEE
jgi:hypothetical protein